MIWNDIQVNTESSSNQEPAALFCTSSVSDKTSTLLTYYTNPRQQKIFNVALLQRALANQIQSQIKSHWSASRVGRRFDWKWYVGALMQVIGGVEEHLGLRCTLNELAHHIKGVMVAAKRRLLFDYSMHFGSCLFLE